MTPATVGNHPHTTKTTTRTAAAPKDGPVDGPADGRFSVFENAPAYIIDGAENMPPFLSTVVTDADLWLYVSSSGALTAGRGSADRSLFHYETDDRLHRMGGLTGPVTRITVDGERAWLPLDPRGAAEGCTRRIMRGDQASFVAFEEHHPALGLTFRQGWWLSETHGIVRRCWLERDAGQPPVEIELVDGLMNLIPAGIPVELQRFASTLADAYTRCELDDDSGLAIYALESRITDRAEPEEPLTANAVWHAGLEGAEVFLDEEAWWRCLRGAETPEPVSLTTGRRGAYLCKARVRVGADEPAHWAIVGDVDLDHARIETLRARLRSAPTTPDELAGAIHADTGRLTRLLDNADASQCSADPAQIAYHRCNTLFNAMRGGVPVDGYRVDPVDFARFLERRNTIASESARGMLASLGAEPTIQDLQEAARETGDLDLMRLCAEYMPLTFGRRHGDPSRPWNAFSVRVRNDKGERVCGYEGNWRDIFQNWEGLCLAYPDLLPGVVSIFLNASTADGFNPYRLTHNGIDWECPDPHNPWANIGYWGDHQIVYLLRLLERLHAWRPGMLETALDRPAFAYANVPYRIRSFDEIKADPKGTIAFDTELDREIKLRERDYGSDARLLAGTDGRVIHVTLLEKLLVPALAKISNIVPGGGVWMNTQRPEWNDANNALAGNGVSMVTLMHLRRYTEFCINLLSEHDHGSITLTSEVASWCDRVLKVLVEYLEHTQSGWVMDDAERWTVTTALGRAFERYRASLYDAGIGPRREYPTRVVTDLFRLARHYCDHAIQAAEREDGLFHSYGVLERPDGKRASVRWQPEMLEGQVAALSSGRLTGERAADLVDSMLDSGLFRPDLQTFLLAPVRERASFLDRNIVPAEHAPEDSLLARLADTRAESIARRDSAGRVRFGPAMNTERDLRAALERLARREGWHAPVTSGRDSVLAAYEATFHHSLSMGRAEQMHKYEGIGCVYWHMVSKLLVAVQESAFDALDRAEPQITIDRLRCAYHRVRDGIGFNHAPRDFGGFPFEPYSHSPLHIGAQQPGMTGQAKEGLIARMGELGVRVRAGEIRLDPVLLRRDELVDQPAVWRFIDATGDQRAIELLPGEIGFTVCGTPFVLMVNGTPGVEIRLRDGGEHTSDGLTIPSEYTTEIARRSGRVEVVRAIVPEAMLYNPEA